MTNPRLSALAIGLMVATAWLGGCGKEQSDSSGARYTQSDYAKNPDGECDTHPSEFYAEKANSKPGIEELIYTSCQYKTRGDHHGREGERGAGIDQRGAHLTKGMACLQEHIAILKALQQVGVMNVQCPGTVVTLKP